MLKLTLPRVAWRKPNVEEALTVGLALCIVPVLCLGLSQVLWLLLTWLDPQQQLPGVISTTIAIAGGFSLVGTMGLVPLGMIAIAYALVEAVREREPQQKSTSV